MPHMTCAAWEALAAAETACRESRVRDAWDALERLSVLDPSNLRARYITSCLSLAEGAFSRAADLIEDYLSLAVADRNTSREDLRAARLMAGLLFFRVGDRAAAAREITACLPLCSEGDKLSLSGILAAAAAPERNPREYRRASAVFRYQAERVAPYRRYRGTAAAPYRVAYLSEDFFAPDTIDLTGTLTGHHRAKVIPSFYRYAPCYHPELLVRHEPPGDLSPDIMDLSGYSPQEAAGIIHEAGPDILVTLTGYRSLGLSPLAVLAYRPAAIQLAGPAPLLLRSAGLNCLDYIIGDQILFGEYEPTGTEEFPPENKPEQNFRRACNASLSRAASAADSRNAGETRNKIHLAYSLSDMHSMTDIIELDEDHAAETAAETYSRLSREEHHRLRDSLQKVSSGLAGGLESLEKFSQNIGSGFKTRLSEGHPQLREPAEKKNPPKTTAVTVPFIKEDADFAEKLLVLPRSLWAANFAPVPPPPDFKGEESEESNPLNRSLIADPELVCLSLTDYRTIAMETLELYRKILQDHPSAKLAFCHDFRDKNDIIRFVKEPMTAAGLPPAQLELVFSPGGPLPLLQPGAFDLLLDDGSAPFAFTARGLAAGLPVITLEGSSPAGSRRYDRRLGGTVLRHVSLAEFIAPDQESYLNLFDRLAGDHKGRKELEETLPRAVRESALGDPSAFLEDLEAAYDFLWQRQRDEAAGRTPADIADDQNRLPEIPAEEIPRKKPTLFEGLKGIFSRKNNA